MKIDPKHITGSSPEAPAVSPGRRGRATSPAGTETDELVLSSRAEEFRRVRPQLDALPESRQDRIAKIRTLVREGTYRVPGDQIADAMLRDEMIVDLLGLGPER